MSSKSKSIAIVAIVFVVGYFVGAIVGVPNFNSEVGSGNISMVSKFHKNTVSPTMSAFQEKLMNDPAALEQAALSLAVISSRMAEFNALVDVALEASKDVPELAEYVETLTNMKTVSENAEQNGKAAIESFDQTFLQKSGAASDYEQASQKLTLAYLLVDRQMKVAKEYVASIDKVLGNNPESNMKLAAVRDLWANYCAGNAYINDDEAEQGYWEKKNPILTSEQLSATFTVAEKVVKYSKPLGFSDEVSQNFAEAVKGYDQYVMANFDSDVKASFDSDVKASFGKDVKAYFLGDVKSAFEFEVKASFDSNVKAGYEQNVKASFEQNVKAGFEQNVKAGF